MLPGYKYHARLYRFSYLIFESLDKVARLKYKIEQVCRDYANAAVVDEEKTVEIKILKKELKKYYREHKDHSFQSYVYNTLFHIPCVFNSGCVVGKRGMTCLEIEGDKIRLVHWFDKRISRKYLKQSGY